MAPPDEQGEFSLPVSNRKSRKCGGSCEQAVDNGDKQRSITRRAAPAALCPARRPEKNEHPRGRNAGARGTARAGEHRAGHAADARVAGGDITHMRAADSFAAVRKGRRRRRKLLFFAPLFRYFDEYRIVRWASNDRRQGGQVKARGGAVLHPAHSRESGNPAAGFRAAVPGSPLEPVLGPAQAGPVCGDERIPAGLLAG
jgi:hypothetical protein